MTARALVNVVANTPDNEWVTWHIVHGGRYTRALCGLRPVRGGPGWTDDELSDLSANCLRCKAELRGAP
jgi:hypothetical protein